MKSIDALYKRIGEYPWRLQTDMADFDALDDAVRDELSENHHIYIERPESDLRCSFCGETREEVAWLVQSPMGPCICDVCALQAIRMMIGKGAEN